MLELERSLQAVRQQAQSKVVGTAKPQETVNLSPLGQKILDNFRVNRGNPEWLGKFQMGLSDTNNSNNLAVKQAFDEVLPTIIEESIQDQNSVLNKGLVQSSNEEKIDTEPEIRTQTEVIEKPRREIEVCIICGRGKHSCGGYGREGHRWPYMKKFVINDDGSFSLADGEEYPTNRDYF